MNKYEKLGVSMGCGIWLVAFLVWLTVVCAIVAVALDVLGVIDVVGFV